MSGMEERKNERKVVDYEVSCVFDSEPVKFFIYDICVDGCCIDTREERVSVGDELMFNFLDGICVEGKIVWKREQYAGVQFKQELHPALVLYLGFKPVAVSIDHVVPRDRFGRKLPAITKNFQGLFS